MRIQIEKAAGRGSARERVPGRLSHFGKAEQ